MQSKFIRDLHSVSIEESKKKRLLKIELYDKYYVFEFKYQWELEMWYRNIWEAIKFQEEIARSVNKKIKYNINLFYIYYKALMGEKIDEIVKEMTLNLNENSKTVSYSTELKAVSRELNSFFDAFYAKKPFLLPAFKFVAIDVHRRIRQMSNKHWNKNWSEMNANEVISFISAFWFYTQVTNYWGIQDTKLNNWLNPLINTFVTKLFASSKQVLATVLYNLRNEFKIEKEKIRLEASDKMEQFINFIFDHYSQVQSKDVAESLSSFISTIFSIFFSNIKNFLKNETFPLQIYIGLINNDFLKIVKKFQKRVHKETKNQISIKQIRIIVDEDFLVTTILDIEKKCTEMIKKYFEVEIHKSFFTETTFPNYLFESFLKSLIKDYKELIDYIENPILQNEIMYGLFDYTTTCYLKLFLTHVNKIYPDDYEKITQKVKKDCNYLERALQDADVEKIDNVMFKINQLKIFLTTNSLDKIIVAITNLSVFHPEFNDMKKIDQLLKSKIFFPHESIDYITSYFRKSLNNKKRKSSYFTKKNLNAAPFNPYVLIFVRKLSKLNRKSCCTKKTVKGASGSSINRTGSAV